MAFLAHLLAAIIGTSGQGPVADDVARAAASTEMMMLACLMLAAVALAAVCNTVASRRAARSAARTARSSNEGLQELLRTVRMAECIAGIGVWQYDPVTGEQQWSDGLKRIFGLEQGADLLAGDAETLLCASDIDLIGKVHEHCEDVQPFALQFDIERNEDNPRIIAFEACNLRDCDGAVTRVVAVVRDITEQLQREREFISSLAAEQDNSARARELVGSDPLTGLANRRELMSELDKLVLNSREAHKPLVLVMFDIDHFKSVNHRFGKSAGDLVLRKVARITEELARQQGVVGRVGGHEFAWIIPGANHGAARIMSERLRQAIARGSAVGQVPPVTISLGYASLQSGDTGLRLFGRADAALFEAKSSGRNRVREAA